MLVVMRRVRSRWRRLRLLAVFMVVLALTVGTTAVGSDIVEDTAMAEADPVLPRVEPLTPPSEPLVASETAPPVPFLQPGIDAATTLAAAAGATVGVAVLDRVAGEEWTNGAVASQPLFGASLAKLFIADHLLYRQQRGELTLTPGDRGLLESLLTVSDDGAADQLYASYGGEQMITEVAARYALPSLQPTNQPPEWELTTISAQDLVRWYDRFLTTAAPTDVDFLIGQLRASPELAADGFNQYFGIPRALPGQVWAIKQGWMNGVRNSAFLHTTGLLGPDNRYAVAILVQLPGAEFPIALIDQLTATILPPDLLT